MWLRANPYHIQTLFGGIDMNKKDFLIGVLLIFIISLIFIGIAASITILGCNYLENQNFKETFYSVSSLKVNNKIRTFLQKNSKKS